MALASDSPGTGVRTARRIARNTTVQTIGGLASRLLTLVFYAVLARELGQTGFGDFSFALAVALVIVIAGFGTDYAVMREVARDVERVHQVFWNSIVVKLGAGAVGLVSVVALGALGGYDSRVQVTIAVLGLATLAEVLARTVHATFRGIEDMAPIAVGLVVEQAWIALGGILALGLGTGLVGAAIAYLSGALVALAYISLRLLSKGLRPRVELSIATVRALARDSLPLASGTALMAVLSRADSAILSFLEGNAAVGLYGAAYKLFEGTTFFTWVFGTALFPVLARLGHSTSPTIGEALELGLKAVVIGLTPVTLVFLLYPQTIIELVYGPGFAESAATMRVLAPSAILWGVFIISMYALAVAEHQRAVAYVLGAGVLLNLGANVALIPLYSYMGAAIAMTASLAVIGCAMGWSALSASQHRLALRRVAAGPVLGSVGAVTVALLAGTGLATIPAALGAYALVVAATERAFFPKDLTLVLRVLRRRRARSSWLPGAGPPADDL